ncbi:MAG: hydrolase [Conexibacter sp.]|nr:hydrolase [Conexibacter sp.]
MSDEFQRIDSETVWRGRILSVRNDRFRHADGAVVTREIVGHPGAVGIVAHDGEHVWLVRQPREAVGEAGLLEIPAGKRDVEDEPPLETAKRELAEEIGKAAGTWEHLKGFYTSPGFIEERLELYLATDLADVRRPEIDDDERIEIVPWPLDRLDDAIAACDDAKSLTGLLLLRLRS